VRTISSKSFAPQTAWLGLKRLLDAGGRHRGSGPLAAVSSYQAPWQLARALRSYALGLLAVLAITVVYRREPIVNITTVGFTFLLAILVAAAVSGFGTSLLMSVAAAAAYDYFFIPPLYEWNISDPQNWVALSAFVVTAAVGSALSVSARQQTRVARRQREEAEQLYHLSQRLLSAGDSLALCNAIPQDIVEAFGTRAAALLLAPDQMVFYSSGGSHLFDAAELKASLADKSVRIDAASKLSYVPLRLGIKVLGSVGLADIALSRETLEALGTVIAIAVERVSAIEALGKAEAARQEERLRSALLDSVTHELRTPLTAIKASVTSLLTQPELSDAQRRELFSVINEESDHLNHLIEEALEMARLDAGEIELKIEPHPIREVIDAAIEASKNLLASHTLEVRLPENLPPVPMDPARIREVLMQLLDNAVKYSPPGTPIIISSDVTDRSLVTSVADHGAGIDSFEQALIFDKFYRGRDQRYGVQGTGMGLAICKAIVEAHGGTMGVTSQVGSGSVFHFNLPLSGERGRVA